MAREWRPDAIVGRAGGWAWPTPQVDPQAQWALSPGTRLQVVEQAGEWLQVRADNGWQGWTTTAYLEPAPRAGAGGHGLSAGRKAALVALLIVGVVVVVVVGAISVNSLQVLPRFLATDTLLREVVQPDMLTDGDEVIAFTLDAPLPAGTVVSAYMPEGLSGDLTPCTADSRTLAAPTWLFWVDDVAHARFAHQTRYVFVDAESYKVTDVTAHGWPPCVDGQPVEQWIHNDQRQKPQNQAFVHLDDAAFGAVRSTHVAEVYRLAPRDRRLAIHGSGTQLDGLLAQAESRHQAIVAINGWLPGQPEVGTHEDVRHLRQFAQDHGLPFFGGDIEADKSGYLQLWDALSQATAGNGGAKSVLLYLTSHGDADATGESRVLLGKEALSVGDLNGLLTLFFPDIDFTIAIDACRSGGFHDLATNGYAVFTCAPTIHDICLGQPWFRDNPGGRFTNALLAQLNKSSDPFADGIGTGVTAAGAKLPKPVLARSKAQPGVTAYFWPKCKTAGGRYYECGMCLNPAGQPFACDLARLPQPSPTASTRPTLIMPSGGAVEGPLRFVAGQPPDGTVGRDYFHDFCGPGAAPPTQGLSLIECMPGAAGTPSGGHPPYHFQLGTLGGFPPFDLHLQKDGVLNGVPRSEGIYSFVVCAVDLDANQVCQTVSITIGSAGLAGRFEGTWQVDRLSAVCRAGSGTWRADLTIEGDQLSGTWRDSFHSGQVFDIRATLVNGTATWSVDSGEWKTKFTGTFDTTTGTVTGDVVGPVCTQAAGRWRGTFRGSLR